MSSVLNSPSLRTDPVRAFTYLFSSPNWPVNLLWLTLAAILQPFYVGTIFTFGYGSELIRYRAGHPAGQTPDLDSARLGDYFVRGLWPFLVYLVAALCLSVLILIPVLCMIFFMVIAGIIGNQAAGEEAAGALVITILVIMSAAIIVGSIILGMYIVPILIRGMITQDFASSFDWAWSRDFVKIMFWEIIVSGIIVYVLSLLAFIVGMAMLCVGVFPASGLVGGASMHLLAQWYEVYLSRGGDPVPEGSGQTLFAQILE